MTNLLTLRKGDSVPHTQVRGVTTGQPIYRGGVPACVWHPLRVIPGKEAASIARLKVAGVYAFCPMSPRVRIVRGKRFETEHATVTQIIYARFRHQPRWDVMKDRNIVTGVFCQGSTPIELPKDVIRILQGLPIKAEALRRAQEDLMRVRVGEAVKLEGGTFDGFSVDVTAVKGRRVWWQTLLPNGMPMRGETDRDGVLKLDVAS